MLIGSTTNKPNVDAVRRIKRALCETLDIPADSIVTVTQLACLEQECAPLETVFGWLRPGEPHLQHRVHKPTEDIVAEDLHQVGVAWGFSVDVSVFDLYLKERK